MKITKNLDLDKIAYWLTAASVFLMPIFVVPQGYLTVPFAKTAVLTLSVILAFILFCIERLKRAEIFVSAPKILIAFAAVVLVYILSSIWSVDRAVSLFGFGGEIETASFIAVLFMFLILVSSLFRRRKDMFILLFTYFGSVGVLLVFQTVRLIGGADFLSFGVLASPSSSIAGRWSEFGIIVFGFLVSSVAAVEMMRFSNRIKYGVYFLMSLAFGFLTIASFSLSLPYPSIVGGKLTIGSFNVNSMVLLALYALGFLIYMHMASRKSPPLEGTMMSEQAPRKRLSMVALIILVAAVAVIFSGGKINQKLSDKFSIVYIESKPTFQTTGDVLSESAVSSFSPRMLLGYGPQTFQFLWNTYKPQNVNGSLFWDVDFRFGGSYLLTSLATVGVAGFIGWIVFLLLSAVLWVKVVFRASKDSMGAFLKISIVMGFLLYALLFTLHVPDVAGIVSLFLFLGLLIAYAQNEGIIVPLKREGETLGKALHFAFSILSIVLIVALGGLFFIWGRKVTANVFAATAIKTYAKTGDVGLTKTYLQKALNLDRKSEYFHFMAQANIYRLGQISRSLNASNAEQYKSELNALVSDAVQFSLLSETLNPSNFRTKIATGDLLRAIGGLGVQNGFDSAMVKYEEAAAQAPRSPLPYLLLAQVELDKNNFNGAKTRLTKALEIKGNYTDAHLLFANINLRQNNIKLARQNLESIISYDPTNINANYSLGLMDYDKKNYAEAAAYFNQSLMNNPLFANGRYFLALSLYNAGEGEAAVAHLEKVLETNPDNADLKALIGKMKIGQPLSPVPVEASESQTDGSESDSGQTTDGEAN